MDTLRRPLAVILGAITLAVAFHFIFLSFYQDSVDPNQVWEILDWFMAFAVLVTLAVTYVRKRATSTDSDDIKEFICVNAAFYAALWLAIWFFWNWFDNLAIGDELQGQLRLTIWGFIDPLFIILVGSASAHLWTHEPGN